MNTLTHKSIFFTKMHGLGNDFVIIPAIVQDIVQSELPITLITDRHRGIGCDQLLIIERSKRADFFCRIFNADGSEAVQCGNGLRCVARYLHEDKHCSKTAFTLETQAGVFQISIQDYDHITLTIPAPSTSEASSVPLKLNQTPHQATAHLLSLGNPHAIIQVTALDTIDVDSLGREIASFPEFSSGINIGFLQVNNPHHITLRTYERGAGQTYACGSNACAAVFSGISNGYLESPVTVEFIHGCLSIEYDQERKLIHMTGPATRVYEGKFVSYW